MSINFYYLPVLLLIGLSFLSSCLQTEIKLEEDDCLARDPVVVSAFSTYNSAWLEVRGGFPPYSYLWSNGATSDSIRNLPRSGGVYSVTITDSKGCAIVDTVEIAPWGCPPGLSSVTDSEGNTYPVVEIGPLCWMAENLKASGNAQLVTDENQWRILSSPAWCYYDNDPTTGGTYGKLYNGWAILNGNLCPSGWHIATVGDWVVLSTHLGGSSMAGGKMKVAGTGYWLAPNTGATNSSGFSALPGGSRSSNGDFGGLEIRGDWWSSTKTNDHLPDNLFSAEIIYNSEYLDLGHHQKKSGLSCRCVKD